MKDCKKCNKDGNVFVKVYDTATGNPKVKRNKKGQLGYWKRCECLTPHKSNHKNK